MCKASFKNHAKIAIAIAVCLSWLAGQAVKAVTTANPPGCANQASIGLDTFCDEAATIKITGNTVVPGETIFYQAILQRTPGQCAASGGVVRVITPDGVSHQVGVVTNLVCGDINCNPVGVPSITFPVVSYTVRAQDMGIVRSLVGVPCDPSNISVQASCSYTGGVNECNGTCNATASTDNCNPVLIPILEVTKLVACSTNNTCGAGLAYSTLARGAADADSSPSFCYSITFTNKGTAAIAFDSVIDNKLGDLTAQSPGALLAGGGTTIFVPIIGPTNYLTSTTNIVTVSAHDAVSCSAVPISASSTAIASVVESVISCDVQFTRGGSVLSGDLCGGDANVGVQVGGGAINVRVLVNNLAGNGQSIQNISVVLNGVPGSPLNLSLAGPIAVGASGSVTFNAAIPDSVSAGITAQAVITAEGALTDSCPPLNTACSNSISICGTNCIGILKLVKCLSSNECINAAGATCSTDISEYSKSASGVVNAPWCYAMVISNCGDLALENVKVVDPTINAALGVPANTPLPGFPTSLDPGESATNFIGPIVYANFVGNKENTATVSGTNGVGSATDVDTAEVTLLVPSIICDVRVNGTAGGDFSIPSGSCTNIEFQLQVCNNGDVDLSNVTITNIAGLCAGSGTVIGDLPANTCSDIIVLCSSNCVSCPDAIQGSSITFSNVVQVFAVASNNLCNTDINSPVCGAIAVSNECEAAVTITCASPGCRTTGGGKQLASEHQVCPIVDPLGGKPVRYVTHGGQVGAPFAQASFPVITDCATGAGTGFFNPCIRGEYTHVRHMQGGLRGNFHAASNGNEHDFDSLKCACLPCDTFEESYPAVIAGNPGCHPKDRLYTGDGITENNVCNPKDSETANCGPLPRKAPANKIAFSGVGDYTLTKGKRTENKVVFRVDIEDRGEPGNLHVISKGKKDNTNDRYRMRMWIIDPDEVDSAHVRALREAVAVKDAHDERVDATLCDGTPTPAPDIDDGGDLDRGNRQIHPTTGANDKCN